MQRLAIHGTQQHNQHASSVSSDPATDSRSGTSSAAGQQPYQSDRAMDDTVPEAGEMATQQAPAVELNAQQQSGAVSTSLVSADKAADRAGPADQAGSSPSQGNGDPRGTSAAAEASDKEAEAPEGGMPMHEAGSVVTRGGISEVAVVPAAQRQQFEGCKLDWKAAFWLATQGGAEALGLEAVCGTLEVGKSFDALRVDTRNSAAFDIFTADTPLDAFQKFVNLGDDRNIRTVWVRGQEISRPS